VGKVGQVEKLQIHPLHTDLGERRELVHDLCGRAHHGRVAAQLVDIPVDGGRAPRDLASSRPAQTTKAAEYVSESRERPASVSAAPTRSYWVFTSSSGANGALNSAANAAARAGVRLAPAPPMMMGGCGR
jgi:hypothetical protein